MVDHSAEKKKREARSKTRSRVCTTAFVLPWSTRERETRSLNRARKRFLWKPQANRRELWPGKRERAGSIVSKFCLGRLERSESAQEIDARSFACALLSFPPLGQPLVNHRRTLETSSRPHHRFNDRLITCRLIPPGCRVSRDNARASSPLVAVAARKKLKCGSKCSKMNGRILFHVGILVICNVAL